MVLPHSPSSHPYSPSLQLKLYQAFIFSVPVLFTIILFLLFYLFYLKRRRPSAAVSSPQLLPARLGHSTALLSLCEAGLEKEIREELPVVVFPDEELEGRDTQCSVCLGDFESEEQLHQLPSCKHLFHVDCIRHWVAANATCPLCRATIFPKRIPRSLVSPIHPPPPPPPPPSPPPAAAAAETEEDSVREPPTENGGSSSGGSPCSEQESRRPIEFTPGSPAATIEIHGHRRNVRNQIIL